MTEHDIQNEIRIALSEHGFCTFRANVGKVHLPDGRWFDTGLPKGFSDLFAVRGGRIYFLEVKRPGENPTKEQVHFIETMKSRYGCIAGVVRSPEDALELVGEL